MTANSRSVAVQIRSSLENENSTTGVSNDSLEPAKKKAAELSTPRRLCLAGLCSSLALIGSSSNSASASFAMTMDGNERVTTSENSESLPSSSNETLEISSFTFPVTPCQLCWFRRGISDLIEGEL
ncbi:hypothetical protein V6N12_003424 [Hibiscus sabdariffa]|uniref:Uncharacterized protein n=1 Tax=Hibiscus sabdariffa TaxID=183260 RepID=A0ABR2AS23_9ROSI